MMRSIRAAAWRLRYSELAPIRGLLRMTYGGKTAICPVCESALRRFLPIPAKYSRAARQHGFPYTTDDFETINAGAYSCPVCGASDRERLIAIYLQNLAASESMPADSPRVIDFAPSAPLSRFIKRAFPRAAYVKADRFQPGVDLRVDLCSMPEIATETVDIWICSHVLEHVDDDLAAVHELGRILKVDGRGLLLVPLLLTNPVLAPSGQVRTVADRWRYFGQGDHVRLYTKPMFLALLGDAGFEVQQWTASVEIDGTPERFGVQSRAVLYVVRKPRRAQS